MASQTRAIARTLGPGESRMMQVWVAAEFLALLHVVAARQDRSLSGFVRESLWERLKREASKEELAEYQAHAWKKD